MHKNPLFTNNLPQSDAAVFGAIEREFEREQNQIELIASENIVSHAVLQAQGCLMTNKYAEGYPGKRYYGGCAYVDEVERLAIDRLKQLFGAEYANVQPHSGSQANQAVFSALLTPGDSILGMALDQGGHLTHGSPVNLSGKWFNAHFYGLDPKTETIDYDALRTIAKQVKPKLIICGASAYARTIDFARFRAVADEVGAYLMADIAHIAGLIAAGEHPSPMAYAHVVTSTTHKTLRGPRGGVVMTNDKDMAKKINSAVFPGLQGGPLMHVIAAKAVAFGEALAPEFKTYQQQVVANARALAARLQHNGLRIVSGGTDNHLMMVDLRPVGVTGKDAEEALERAGITCNKNAIPGDPQPPKVTSGIRVGTPAGTSRGFGTGEFEQVADWMYQVLEGLAQGGEEKNAQVEHKVRQQVKNLCAQFPLYAKI